MARGGYRKPTNPAPVSGPGSLSQRTDGGPADTQAARYISGLPYGEGQEMMNIQQSAPMAAAPSIEQSNMPPGLASAAASQSLIPLNAPSNRPDEPVTHGADMGPGGSSAVLGLPNNAALMNQDVQNMSKYIPYLESIANQPESSNAVRLLVRYLKSQAV
jgi:hypothetical protein